MNNAAKEFAIAYQLEAQMHFNIAQEAKGAGHKAYHLSWAEKYYRRARLMMGVE